ncbi:MAG: hypothetical protein ACMVY4_04565 [Minwuia sp.]|uniref:hypothetical protein n=1 Tax=Minwuia sp. TaxID=2493630 RepID=UPI003A8746CE
MPLLIAAMAVSLAPAAAGANDLLNLLPGRGASGVHGAKPSYDRADQRRVPSYRHQSQMSRHQAQRDFQRAQAERAWSQTTVTAPAADNLPVLIRPTMFTYEAALQGVLRIAQGDRVNFHTASRSGFIELLEIAQSGDTTCRRFRQTVRTPAGTEIGYGDACRLRDGAWRFEMK